MAEDLESVSQLQMILFPKIDSELSLKADLREI